MNSVLSWAADYRVRAGTPAPDFDLPSHTGERVRLGALVGKAPVVLFFYPQDDTPGCTAEACAFRDEQATFEQLDALVFGISSDDGEAHQRFAKRYGLPMQLLTDRDGSVRRAYDVRKTLGLLPGRTSFLIDREGIVRARFDSQLEPKRHVAEMIGALRKLIG